MLALVALALAGTGGGFAWYLASRPAPYRPGEELSDITRSLESSLPADAPRPLLVDVTEEAGLDDFVQFEGGRTSQLPEDMGSGAAWGDFDGDGDDDLFLVAAGGALDLPEERRAPSVLYENLGDGRFSRVAGFPEPRIIGMGAAWGDYDGDGRLDLAVSGYRSLLLLHNDGGGAFSPEPALPAEDGYWSGVAWGDFDRDGDLDLYVCGYVQYEERAADRARATMQYGRSVPYTLNPASYKPERNLLLRNDRGDGFADVAAELGVDNREGRSLSALWHDFDDDGWLDLYVANDISDNAFYRNTGGGFEDLSHPAWVADYRGAMGLAVGDYNRDGDDDLFVTHWVAQENALYDSQLKSPRGGPIPQEEVPVRFVDVADQHGLGQSALRVVGWGTEFVDLDADGWLDLVVANGSTFEDEETPPRLVPEEPFVFWNERGGQFHDLAPLAEALKAPHVARGLAVADYDGDGDPDILIVRHGEGVQLLRNDMTRGRALELRLRQRGAGFGDGTRIVAHVAGVELRRTVGGASYLSQSSRTLHLGLGDANGVDRLEVRWPDGEQQIFEGLAAGALWELTQGDGTPRRIELKGATQADAGSERDRLVRFWRHQRAGMQAMKVDGDLDTAIAEFRQALALKPDHGDSLYYLASCLAARGDVAGAIEQLETLTRVDPLTHRGYRQLGVLRAMAARFPSELGPAREALERSLEINREETGSLLVLGELELLAGRPAAAEERLAWACRTNPKAVSGFYLRGYVAWLAGQAGAARALLEQAQAARGKEWKPEGATAEGDVARKMHDDDTPLSPYWRAWDGTLDPAAAYAPLDDYLKKFGGHSPSVPQKG